MESYCVIENNGFKILDYNTLKQNHDDSVVHFIGTYKECIGFIARSNAAQELVDSANREHELYFIKDETWPSRRWNKDMTDYIDLSGDEQLYEQEQLKETYTRDEVYQVARRSVHVVINGILTDNSKPIEEVINSEIDTVKLF